MRLALVLSVSTLACATWGGRSAVPERDNCAWQVCVRSRDGRAGRTCYVVNADPVRIQRGIHLRTSADGRSVGTYEPQVIRSLAEWSLG
jgi:hypothetical protein